MNMLLNLPATVILLAVITAVSFAAWQRESLVRMLAFKPYKVWRGKGFYTLFTAGFVHADVPHLFFNGITLYLFGTFLEQYYAFNLGIGASEVLVLFCSAIVVANIPSLFLYKDKQYYSTLGASGGVEAIVFASILVQPFNDVCLYFFLCLPAFAFGGVYLIYSLWQSRQGMDNKNHEAHLAGAAWGLAFQTYLTPEAWARLAGG